METCPVVLFVLRKSRRAGELLKQGGRESARARAGGRASWKPIAIAPMGSTALLLGFCPTTSFLLHALVASFSLDCSLVGEEALVLEFIIFSLIHSKLSFFSPNKAVLSSKVFWAAMAA